MITKVKIAILWAVIDLQEKGVTVRSLTPVV